MNLLDLIRQNVIRREAAATTATTATFESNPSETVATVGNVAAIKSRTDSDDRAGKAKVDEMRCLLVRLMWDAPAEVEPEILRAVRDDALDETLAMYRRCLEDYQRIGEIARHWKAP